MHPEQNCIHPEYVLPFALSDHVVFHKSRFFLVDAVFGARESRPTAELRKIHFVYARKLTVGFFHFCNGLCYNGQEAIALYSFHIHPFYWVVWSLFSIKDLKGFR